jgi:molybdate transport system substrate-binding protein
VAYRNIRSDITLLCPALNPRTRRFSLRWPALALLAVFALTAIGARAADLTVSAAASLGNALRELGSQFEAAHPGSMVRLNVGASGALLQQAARGAPVDVLVSADQETLDQAQTRGLIVAATRRNIATNTLVVVLPAGSARRPAVLADLAQPTIARIAIGLPASVPAGLYARSALESAGLWATVEPRLIGATTVRQALDYVARGEVDAGFVYATDAALLPGRVRVAFSVPTARPIVYPAAVLAAAPQPALAARFVEFLLTPPAQAVLARHGFGRP